jgi:uncharacterized protein (DUF362 family)
MSRSGLAQSPFKKSQNNSTVHVSGGKGPYSNTLAVLAGIDLSPASGKRVLLKPNAGRVAAKKAGVTTDAMVVAATIDAFCDAGAKVAVGESPIVGVRAKEALEASGITRVAVDRNCEIIDLNERPFIKVPVVNGLAIDSLKVCPEILEYDIVVSIPVMKMHMHTGVSLAIKNMKGCLWRRSKVDLHMLEPVKGSDEKPIDIAIADMSGVLTPHFSVIDGTVGMEGLGPSAGIAKPLDVVVAGVDGFAADSVACRLMGVKAENIPHLRIGSMRGNGVIDIDRILVAPDTWERWISPFSTPPESLSIEFPNINVLDKKSCSACQSTLFLFLKRYQKMLFEYFPSDRPVNIAIGSGHDELPEGTLSIGNCTSSCKGNGVFVPGCPPVSSEIMRSISGKPSFDTLDGLSKISDLKNE